MIFIQNSLFVGAVNVSQFLGSKAGILASKFWKSSWSCMFTVIDVRLSALYATHDAKFPEDRATFDEYFQKIWSCERPKWPLVWVWQSVELFDTFWMPLSLKSYPRPQVPLVYPNNQLLYLETNSSKIIHYLSDWFPIPFPNSSTIISVTWFSNDIEFVISISSKFNSSWKALLQEMKLGTDSKKVNSQLVYPLTLET